MANLERRILLVGGEEFRPAAVGMDRHLLQSTGKDAPRVAIIPTAAARENPQLAASNGVRHFNGLGADAYGVDVIQRADAENPRIAAQLDGADVIYFTGGSPEHLHSVLAGSPLLDAVVAANTAGTIWAGSSAGAMVLGAVMRRPSSGSPLSPALNVVPNVMTLPHHERSDPEAVLSQLSGREHTGLTVLGIDGGSGVLLKPGGATALGGGNVTVYRDGSWKRYEGGEAIPGLTVDGA
ncbi:MAG: Type 1 glutamine amidotransferase-like domain-containing protein [Chloroflexota bacterium]|nr:Type 1 glutamine amidotransferase-like domain-containing protein [Chloroflexota bacterium]MDE2685055.1 Type 1 glutamine amidotransferase-like domain-containing protein [Chloroflexota bacterium]